MDTVYPDRSCRLERGRGANDMRWFGAFKGAIAALAMEHDGGHSDCEWCDVSDVGRFTGLPVEIFEQQRTSGNEK